MSEPSQSANVGTVRTGWNATLALIIAAVIGRYTTVNVDMEDPIVIAVLGGAITVFYRLSRVISDRYTWVGYVLFGSPRTPSYQAQPPAPAPPEEVHAQVGAEGPEFPPPRG